MHNRGIYAAPRGMFIVSTPMTETEIDTAIEAFKGALALLKPYIAEVTPYFWKIRKKRFLAIVKADPYGY